MRSETSSLHHFEGRQSLKSRKDAVIVVFAHTPAAENKSLGLTDRAASRVHARLLENTLRMAHATGARVVHVHDSPDSEVMQRGTGFEERFLNALKDVAALGIKRMVVIGSDSPGLNTAQLQKALAAPQNKVCIGPSVDGGIYLLGLNASDIHVLKGLPWKKRSLFRVLRSRVTATVLGRLSDVDTWQDLYKIQKWLGGLDLSASPAFLRLPRPPTLMRLESSVSTFQLRSRGPPVLGRLAS